jgi:hypothetical protein
VKSVIENHALFLYGHIIFLFGTMNKKNKNTLRLSRKTKIILAVVLFLIIIRLLLPAIMLHYANKSLAVIPGYYGHIEDIDIALYRGAYKVNNFYLDKLDTIEHGRTPFISSRLIDISIEWKALFHGSVVGKLMFDKPDLYFVKDKSELKEVKKDTSTFRDLVDKFMPLKINQFEIFNGTIHYVDNTSNPPLDLKLSDTHILATNLTNVYDNKTELPSTVEAQASAYDGSLKFNMRLNALAEKPAFDLNVELVNTDLVKLNSFLKAYGNFDVNKGSFGLYTEMAAENGKFRGYVKPIIKNLDVVGPEDRHNSFLQKAWEVIVGAAGFALKNHPENQIATKVPIEGNLNDPQANTLDAIWMVLFNAFVQALVPEIDNQISIKSLSQKENHTGFLNKLFGNSEHKTAKKK